ncbi:2-oxoglutarate receptor 1-like [Ambystoma mexicanum]|uniref:2-oxoglutarate receptor 1-like n=1 Tax=Ambystoma mexicanum TaxID=8296 RepID=UPI0037E884DB
MNESVGNLENATLQNSTECVNCTAIEENYIVKGYYLPAMYSIIFLVGFPGNIICIIIYIFKMRPWRSSLIIMLNLAIADLLYLVSLPFLVYNYTQDESGTLGNFLCSFVRLVFHLNLYGSILFLACFSIFRFFVIVHPMHFTAIHRKRWAKIACALVWGIALVEVIPIGTMFTSKEPHSIASCLDFASSNELYVLRWYNWLLTVLGFALPLVIVTLCYTRIICTLSKGPYASDTDKKRACRLIVVLLVVFNVCYVPFHILRGLRIEARVHSPGTYFETHIHAVYIIFRPIAALNIFGNLFLYAAIGDNFQKAFMSVWRGSSSIYVPRD